jgi:hypothetical protein
MGSVANIGNALFADIDIFPSTAVSGFLLDHVHARISGVIHAITPLEAG